MHIDRRAILFVALLAGGSAAAAVRAAVDPCEPACGSWQLDTQASDDPLARIDAALAEFKEERRRPLRIREPAGRTADGQRSPRDEAAELGIDLREPPVKREDLRAELRATAVIPERLTIGSAANEVILEEGGPSPRRLTPGEPHSRVDTQGIATIRTKLSGGKLSIEERYGRSHGTLELYAVDRKSGRLIVTRTIERPRLAKVVIRSVYLRR